MGLWWNTEPDAQPFSDIATGFFQYRQSGAIDWPGTLSAARSAADVGTSSLLALAPLEQLSTRVHQQSQLRSMFSQHGLDIQIRFAAEETLTSDLFDRVVRSSILLDRLNRKYVFLRIPSKNRLPVAPVVRSISRMGLQVILIDAESNAWLRRNPAEWQQVVETGAMIRVSSDCFRSDRSDAARSRFVRKLIRRREIHFVGSDLSAYGQLRESRSQASLKHAHNCIKRWAGSDFASRVCRDNAANVLGCVFESPQNVA